MAEASKTTQQQQAMKYTWLAHVQRLINTHLKVFPDHVLTCIFIFSDKEVPLSGLDFEGVWFHAVPYVDNQRVTLEFQGISGSSHTDVYPLPQYLKDLQGSSEGDTDG